MKTKQLLRASYNELEELTALCGELDRLITRDYLHVEDYFPKSIIESIRKFRDGVNSKLEEQDNF